MAEPVTGTEQIKGGPVQGATDDESKFKAWLKEKYEIEDDPDSYKGKRAAWKKAEEEIPQYQSTLTALIEHIKQNQDVVQQPNVRQDEFDEEKIRNLSKLDPYEGTKRTLARFEKQVEEKLNTIATQSVQQAEALQTRREGLKRAHDIVKENWPEAFDTQTELHKMGRQVFQNEMSPMEQNHPLAFLIATERAAGRLGVAPKARRSSNASNRRDVSAQSVSRSGTRQTSNEDDKPLSGRQKQVIAGLGVDEKTYKEALKIRKSQRKKTDEEDD